MNCKHPAPPRAAVQDANCGPAKGGTADFCKVNRHTICLLAAERPWIDDLRLLILDF
jgi:hypothetical protein